ncbi:hypothetical protein [Haloferula sargassicola]|uniref:DUF3109 family protein n=1 Tax=Haloferula sargassicola TaxID=490096 RepID=A0ABP9UIY6_9BACT
MTAYPGIERELARQIREAALDHEAFELPLKVCELATCRATCCHDGAILEAEQMAGIREVVGARRDHLRRYGWDHDRFLEENRTATLQAADSELADGFPGHFPRTRCVFLDAEHRCVLQRLAMDEGRHPWFWKPVSCWMHPLLLRPRERGGRPVLTLARSGDDPAGKPGYPGFGSCTPCGLPRAGGEPAWQVLRGELELLSEISGRDLLRELS